MKTILTLISLLTVLLCSTQAQPPIKTKRVFNYPATPANKQTADSLKTLGYVCLDAHVYGNKVKITFIKY